MSESKKITLGSGYVYALEYNGSIPTDEDIETDANRLGYVQAGATITYAPTYYEVKDDNGDIDEIYITDEVITMKMGIMTWTGNTLNKLCATARVTESGGVRTVKIGGTANDDGKKYILRFVHKSGAIRATIIGTNQNGFELAFAKDKETVINPEFKALKPLDDDGTKLIYSESIIALTGLTVTSGAGSTLGKTEITVSETAGAGNSFVYRVRATAAVDVVYGQDLASWATLISGNEYTLTNGHYITVAEITANGAAVRAGSATIVSNVG